jgi:N-carbamoyl-L-amino-acid hydrolase
MTIVPGTFNFSLDVRAYDEAVLADLDRQVDAIIAGIEQRRGVVFHRGTKARATVGQVAPVIKAGLEAGAVELGIPVLRLGSPASHDAAAFGAAGVPMGMIFIRNENGSHNPREAMAIDDFLAGASLLTWFLAHHTDTSAAPTSWLAGHPRP